MTFFLYEFFYICWFFLICFFLSVIILLFSFLIANSNPDTEKLSSYECGFDPYEDARNTFDIRFYIIAILFLIFDLETVYFFPWSLNLSFFNLYSFISMLDFLFELIIGFFYAWLIGALEWE
jgi:NADH-quinone oxidoreductase subunit A